MGHVDSSTTDSRFVGVLGGGYGEPPVRVADLEAAAARRSAARRMLTETPQDPLADTEPSDVEDYAQLGEN
jgi:hypothetical protein